MRFNVGDEVVVSNPNPCDDTFKDFMGIVIQNGLGYSEVLCEIDGVYIYFETMPTVYRKHITCPLMVNGVHRLCAYFWNRELSWTGAVIE